jgi:hypothetical protein
MTDETREEVVLLEAHGSTRGDGSPVVPPATAGRVVNRGVAPSGGTTCGSVSNRGGADPASRLPGPITNHTATLAALQQLVAERTRVRIVRHYPGHGTFNRVGVITSAFADEPGTRHDGPGFGIMFHGDGFGTALALPRAWTWTITVEAERQATP